MADVAGKMAGSISAALNLANADAADQWQGNKSDPYEAEQLAAALAEKLGGSASDVGNLSRALHELVQEGAALFGVRPESRSLALLQSLTNDSAGSDAAASLASVAKQIDTTTSNLQETAA